MNQVATQISKNILKILTAIIIIGLFAYILFPFLSSLVLGAILAFALSTTVSHLEEKKISRRASLNYLMLTIFLVFFAPTLAFFIKGSGVLTRTINNPENAEKLNHLIAIVTEKVETLAPTLGLTPEDIRNYSSQLIQKSTEFTLGLFSKVMSEVPDIVLFSIILMLSTYFFLKNEDEIRELFDNYFYFDNKNGNRFIEVIKSSSREIFLSNVLTGLIQSSLVTFGAAIFGFEEWFLIFFITFIASFIPVLGAGPIALILALLSLASDNYGSAIGMLVVSIVSGTADNIIRPYLVSRGTVEVPAVISFFAVIGGVITLGLPGLFLGPLVASLAFGVLPIILEEFLPAKKKNSPPITYPEN